ncbi:MAG TPA: hypothetical protein VIO14_06385 [Dehalococcoidia bacterium]
MSIYHALGVEPPVILFSVLHQPDGQVDGGQYAARAAGFQRGVRKQDAAIRERTAAWLAAEADRWSEAVARRAAAELGADGAAQAALAAALRDELLGWAEDLTHLRETGLQASWECRTVRVEGASAGAARLLEAGGQYLASLGMASDGPPVHESLFLFRGSVHYDLMEHLVRDRMGIYAGPHGALIQHVARTLFGTFNALDARGERPEAPDGWEVNLPFSKGPIQYGEFRAKLTRAVEALHRRLDGAWASAWQRKLGLGQVREFSLRFVVPRDPAALEAALAAVAEADDYLAEGVVRRGRMLVLERVPV